MRNKSKKSGIQDKKKHDHEKEQVDEDHRSQWKEEQEGEGDEIELTINQDFAKKYEHRKRKEELSKLKEKYEKETDGSNSNEEDSESDEEEDDFGELVTPEVDAQIMKTIALIRKKDPILYNKEVDLFSAEQIENAKKQWQEKQKGLKEQGKPLRLKDYHRENLLKGNMEDSDEEQDQHGDKKRHDLTYVEEQAEMKKELTSALHSVLENKSGKEEEEEDDDDDEAKEGGLFTIRKKNQEELKKEEEEYEKFLKDSVQQGLGEKEGKEFWDSLISKKTDDPNEAFLVDYVLNRGWIEKGKDRLPDYHQIVELEDDEDHVEEMEEFERLHNFRFEEEGSHQIVTHARDVPNTLRRADSKRKDERQRRKERKEEEKLKKKEELKRFKNLKKQEILKKLKKIHEIAGLVRPNHENNLEKEDGSKGNQDEELKTLKVMGLDEVDMEKVLEDDFDPENYDNRMNKIFNDDYYNQEDPLKKPIFEDDIDIGDIGELGDPNDDQGYYDGEEEYYDETVFDDGDNRYAEDEHVENEELEKANKKKKNKKSKNASGEEVSTAGKTKKMALGEYLDEYYKLDYEDMIGDLPTRFKYVQVPQQDYGLTPVEILMAEDTVLNQYFGLKKMAPYRKPEILEKDMMKFKKSRKKRKREFLKALEEQDQQYTSYDYQYDRGDQGNSDKKSKRKENHDMQNKGISGDRLASYELSNSSKFKKSKKKY